jgi:hypothetical protein
MKYLSSIGLNWTHLTVGNKKGWRRARCLYRKTTKPLCTE